jgi:hypothetical protein
MSSKLKIVKVTKLQLEKAVNNLEYVKHATARKYATNATAAQAHIGVISNLDADLEVIKGMLNDFNYAGGEDDRALAEAEDENVEPNVGDGKDTSEVTTEDTATTTEPVKKPGRPKKTQ